ncbi:MAG: type II toxin-antitoxin system HipA family toxin YjjJ [Opitutaceae bacterium]
MASSFQLGRLALSLQTHGVSAASTLKNDLDISQPTLSRWLTSLGPRMERMGARQFSRYALRRDVRNLGNAWPLYRVDETGHPEHWGELRALYGGFRLLPQASPLSTWLEASYPDHLYPGLPFFLQDARPEGYIGRAISRRVGAALRIPEDPRNWSDDDLLAYLLAEGDDLPGDLILGDRALERALRAVSDQDALSIRWEDRATTYPARAEAAQRGELAVSSAGGEQPKFLATIRRNADFTSVLVKFSPADPSPAQRRWLDLLVCEHLAGELLLSRGIPAARTSIMDAGGRRFLEVERFDRSHARGRRGLLTMGSLEEGILDESATDWSGTAAFLERAQCLGHEQARRLRWLWCFGDLIGNTDMHRGNTSVFFDAPPFSLAPSYDMLPMLHSPDVQGGVSARAFTPRPPMPAVADVWSEAAQTAVEFWGTVGDDGRISSDYRRIAENCRDRISELRRQFA